MRLNRQHRCLRFTLVEALAAILIAGLAIMALGMTVGMNNLQNLSGRLKQAAQMRLNEASETWRFLPYDQVPSGGAPVVATGYLIRNVDSAKNGFPYQLTITVTESSGVKTIRFRLTYVFLEPREINTVVLRGSQ